MAYNLRSGNGSDTLSLYSKFKTWMVYGIRNKIDINSNII